MKKNALTPEEVLQLRARYRALRLRLGKLDSISQGSVLPNPPNAWRWTRKVAGKTVSVGLSPQKALLMLKAIENQRAMDQIIDEMRAITQRLILDDPLPEKAKPKKS